MKGQGFGSGCKVVDELAFGTESGVEWEAQFHEIVPAGTVAFPYRCLQQLAGRALRHCDSAVPTYGAPIGGIVPR